MKKTWIGLCMALSLVAGGAQAQADYPNKPIRLLIPFPPGGGTDFVARTVGQKLAESTQWSIVLENMPGAGGNLAIAATARAAPDGYTIVMGQSDNMMLGPWIYPKVGYDTIKNFVPIVQTTVAPLVIVSQAQVANGKPLTKMSDLVAKGRTGEGVSWASAGNGTVGHLFVEQFRRQMGGKYLHVPYKGATPALNDLMGGSVDAVIVSVPSALGLIQSGKLKAVAVTTPQRSGMLPDTPTLVESGIKGMDVGIWLGLFAPTGTPPAIVARINAEVNKVLSMPDVKEKLANGGSAAVGGTAADFAQLVRTDYQRWGKIAREAAIKLE